MDPRQTLHRPLFRRGGDGSMPFVKAFFVAAAVIIAVFVALLVLVV